MKNYSGTKLILVVFILCQFILKSQGQPPRMMFGDSTRIGVAFTKDPHVIKFGKRYLMYYTIPAKKSIGAGVGWNIAIAESKNLVDWKRVSDVKFSKAPEFTAEQNGICAPCALVIKGKVHLFYQTYGNGAKDAICHAVSADGISFERNLTNPIFRASGDWNCGRAIDAEVTKFKGRYFLYFATRDPKYRVQIMGVATAPGNTNFNRETWTQVSEKPILSLEYPWEGGCTEGASIIHRNSKLYMFYAANFNNAPQQIGVAESTDGISWKKCFDKPFLANGKKGEWNSSESGHPHIFDNGKTSYLFYQGNNDGGKTWWLSNFEVKWNKKGPFLP